MTMIVTLNSELKPVDLSASARAWNLQRLTRTLAFKAKDKGYTRALRGLPENDAVYHEGFMGLLSHCYSNHLPIAIRPHDFWFIANMELAAIIAKNVEQFRHIFTDSPEKKQVVIEVKSYDSIDYVALADALESRIPNKDVLDLLIPHVSTMSGIEFGALCATFADMVQHYYDYMTMCCGLPMIKVLGKPEDYRLLADNAIKLRDIFRFNDETATYYERISGLFNRMSDSFGDPHPENFWRDIYTHKNVGSGGELSITGWIRDFYSKRPDTLKNYSTSIASVPYKNIETQREFIGLVGAFSSYVDHPHGFYRARYSSVTYEKQ